MSEHSVINKIQSFKRKETAITTYRKLAKYKATKKAPDDGLAARAGHRTRPAVLGSVVPGGALGSCSCTVGKSADMASASLQEQTGLGGRIQGSSRHPVQTQLGEGLRAGVETGPSPECRETTSCVLFKGDTEHPECQVGRSELWGVFQLWVLSRLLARGLGIELGASTGRI